jgi:uncharacterized spore protein YtfJ
MEELEGKGNDELARVDTETRELIEKVARVLGRSARAEVVFGEPVERDGITAIPVATASVGLGGGPRSEGESTDGGLVGAGMRMSPEGYIEVGDGRVRLRRILPTWAFVSIALGIGAFASLLLIAPRR